MSDDIAIKLEERKVIGKGLNGLRAQGLVPAVIHDHGKESIHVMADLLVLNKAYSAAGKHHPVQLKVGNKERLALIKDVDFEPAKRRMRHVVFQAIRQDEKATTEIPVVLTGEEIPAEKAGLLVLTQLDKIEVEALPKDLVDQLEVDATSLSEVGDKIHVSDIKLPNGITLLADPEQVIATVEIPKDQIAEADAAAAELAADKAEGEAEEEAEEEPEAADETSPETKQKDSDEEE